MENITCISKMLNSKSPTKGNKIRSNSNDLKQSRKFTEEIEMSSFFMGKKKNKLPSPKKRKGSQMSVSSGDVQIFSPQDKPGIEPDEEAKMNILDILEDRDLEAYLKTHEQYLADENELEDVAWHKGMQVRVNGDKSLYNPVDEY